MALAAAQVVDNLGNVSVVIFTNQTAAANGGWFDISAIKDWSVHVTDITSGDVVTVSVSSAATRILASLLAHANSITLNPPLRAIGYPPF